MWKICIRLGWLHKLCSNIPAEYRQILVHDNSRYNLVHTWSLNQYGIGTESKRDRLGWNHATVALGSCLPHLNFQSPLVPGHPYASAARSSFGRTLSPRDPIGRFLDPA